MMLCNLEIFITSVYGNDLKMIQSEIVVLPPEIDYNNFILNQVKSESDKNCINKITELMNSCRHRNKCLLIHWKADKT